MLSMYPYVKNKWKGLTFIFVVFSGKTRMKIEWVTFLSIESRILYYQVLVKLTVNDQTDHNNT